MLSSIPLPWRRQDAFRYDALDKSESGNRLENSDPPTAKRKLWEIVPYIVIGFITTLILVFTVTLSSRTVPSSHGECSKPTLRQEWRMLSTDQRLDFIRSFNCLADKPSRMDLNGTLYDDFAWLHGMIGALCTRSDGNLMVPPTSLADSLPSS